MGAAIDGSGADDMNTGLLVMALIAGAANWAFRYLPTRASGAGRMPGGALGRFLAATGPAAIATLLVAALLPEVVPQVRAPWPLGAGIGAVLAVFASSRSVAAATIAGAVAYGAAAAVFGG
jgi:Na+/phosphate symporter